MCSYAYPSNSAFWFGGFLCAGLPPTLRCWLWAASIIVWLRPPMPRWYTVKKSLNFASGYYGSYPEPTDHILYDINYNALVLRRFLPLCRCVFVYSKTPLPRCRSPPPSIWISQISDWSEETTMDEKRPKRRKDKDNPYTLSKRQDKHYLSFRDGQGVLRELLINKELFELLNCFCLLYTSPSPRDA